MGLTGAPVVHELFVRAGGLTLPGAPRRRFGSDAIFRSALAGIQADLAEADREAAGDAESGEDPGQRARVDLSLELASLLFAAGAPHSQWRWWAASAAGALREQGDSGPAAVWSVLAHDGALVRRLPEAPEPGTRPDGVVWWLAGHHTRHDPDTAGTKPVDPDETVDSAWHDLTLTIPRQDHVNTGRALRTITDFWLDEDDDWERFHPRSYPDFEPELNAVATLARSSGWEPVDWPADALRFLEPGLAPGTAS